MYIDCFGNDINQEILPSEIISQLSFVLNDPANTIEISRLICSKISIKKIFDASITDTPLALCFVNQSLQNAEDQLSGTKPSFFEYNIFLIEIIELKSDPKYVDRIDYIKLRATNKIDFYYIRDHELPFIIVENENYCTENTDEVDVFDNFHKHPYRIRELYSQINQRASEAVVTLASQLGELETTTSRNNLFPKLFSSSNTKSSSSVCLPSTSENGFNYSNSKEVSEPELEKSSCMPSVESFIGFPITDTDDLSAQYCAASTCPIYSDIDNQSSLSHVGEARTNNSNAPSVLDFHTISEYASAYEFCTDHVSEDNKGLPNDVLHERPSELENLGHMNNSEPFAFSREAQVHEANYNTKVPMDQSAGGKRQPKDHSDFLQGIDFYMDEAETIEEANAVREDVMLVLPISKPYFPSTTVKNLKVKNPIVKQSIMQLFTQCKLQNRYNMSRDETNKGDDASVEPFEDEGVVIGLFFVKNPGFKSHSLIKTSADINHVGVTGKVTSYSLFNSLSKKGTSGKAADEVLLLNIDVQSRVKIETLFLPSYFQQEKAFHPAQAVKRNSAFEKYQGVYLNQLVTFAEVKALIYEDLVFDVFNVKTLDDEKMTLTRRCTTSSMSVLKKLLKALKSILGLDKCFFNFKQRFEEEFEHTYSQYETFNKTYGPRNILKFFSCYEDTSDLLLMKNDFLIDIIQNFTKLKFEHFYQPNQVFDRPQEYGDIYSTLYNSNKKGYFWYYSHKLQEILEAREFHGKCRLIHKAMRNELSILEFELEQYVRKCENGRVSAQYETNQSHALCVDENIYFASSDSSGARGTKNSTFAFKQNAQTAGHVPFGIKEEQTAGIKKSKLVHTPASDNGLGHYAGKFDSTNRRSKSYLDTGGF